MTDLTTKEYWSGLKRKVTSKEKRTAVFEFREIFKEYLVPSKGIALEVGCVPGNFLAYICKNFGYFPEGIDYDEKTLELTSQTLRNNGLNNFKIYQEDFNKWQPEKKYNLVCSFGFVEHFDNPKTIIKKHINLMAKKGKLIIGIPNFAGFNGFLHKLIDKPCLDKHNTKIMNLDFFRRVVEENNLKIIYLGYYGSWHFQWGYGRRQTANIFQIGVYAFLKIISKLTKLFIMRNKLSNYIIFIAEKK